MRKTPTPQQAAQDAIDALGIETTTRRHEHAGLTLHIFATCPYCGARNRAYIAVTRLGGIAAACDSKRCDHEWGWADLRRHARRDAQ